MSNMWATFLLLCVRILSSLIVWYNLNGSGMVVAGWCTRLKGARSDSAVEEYRHEGPRDRVSTFVGSAAVSFWGANVRRDGMRPVSYRNQRG